MIYHFNFDEDFQKTDFYKKYKEDNLNDFVRIAKEFTDDDIGKYIMNGVHDFTKTLTQTLKKSAILNKDIEGKDKISKANRIVKQTTEKLNPDKEKDKQLNIPKDIFTKDVIDKAKDILNNFFK